MRPEVRMSRYLDGIYRYSEGRLSCVEAAELLGIGASAGRLFDALLEATPFEMDRMRAKDVADVGWWAGQALVDRRRCGIGTSGDVLRDCFRKSPSARRARQEYAGFWIRPR